MAENKKSFIAYVDWKNTFESLPDDKAGQLIKHIFRYVNDENPETDDILINAVFANIKNTLKRDLDKWEKNYNQRVMAGRNSAKKRKEAMNARQRPLNESQQTSTVSVSVSDSVSYYRQFKHLKLTEKEFDEIKKIGYSKNQIDSILDSIENYSKNKNYTSLNLTARKWLKREYPDINQKKIDNPYTNM